MGIGNLLLSDDGVGVHAVYALREQKLSDKVEILEVGTAFFDALPALEKIERIIVIDAVMANGPPGTIYRLPLEKCTPSPMNSLHDFDIFGMLAFAGNPLPVEVMIMGVEPEKLDWGVELSPKVSQALPDLLDHVCRELEMSNN